MKYKAALLPALLLTLGAYNAATPEEPAAASMDSRTLAAAEQGDADAQFMLCKAYAKGEGVELSHTSAVGWCRRAAESGHAKAQFYLGVMYATGQGVSQDQVQASEWFRKSADQGNAEAQVFLGFLYKQGNGVPKENAQAFKLFRKAAEQGNSDAQYSLGFMYHHGEGVPQDNVQAYAWLNVSAAESRTAVVLRDAIGERMTENQIAEAHELSREIQERIRARASAD